MAVPHTGGRRCWPPPIVSFVELTLLYIVVPLCPSDRIPDTGYRKTVKIRLLAVTVCGIRSTGLTGFPGATSASTLTRCEQVSVDIFVRKTHATTAKAL